MPATSIRDVVIKDNDLLAGTHGRGFWILDDISALRQLNTASATVLYKPAPAYRVRWNMNTDTPLPQEEPAGQNPPDGAIIDYNLDQDAGKDITLEITDAKGNLVRRFSGNDHPYDIPPVNIPLYWIRPQEILSGEKGAHRFIWDLHYTPLNLPPSYPIAAVYRNTAPDPTSPWVQPGTYTVKLTCNGKSYSQPLVIKMDPRVKTSPKDLQIQHDLSLQCYQARQKLMQVLDEISERRKSLEKQLSVNNDPKLQQKLDLIVKLQNTARGNHEPSIGMLENNFAALHNILQDSDMPPTTQTIGAVKEALASQQALMKKWEEVKQSL
jgi:hypothetical protein